MRSGWAIFIVPAMLLLSCNQAAEHKDGGPCSYDRKVLPAKLIALPDINEKYYDAVLVLSRDGGSTDTVNYSMVNNKYYIAVEQIPKDSLKIGSNYQYIEQRIKSGYCNPQVDWILLKPFEP